MKKKTSWILFGCLVFQFLFSSCASPDKRMEDFIANYPTLVDQLDFFVSEAKGDVAMIARMLEVDVSYIDNVRIGVIEPNTHFVENLNGLVSQYCKNGGFARWRYTKSDYGEARWYDWAVIIMVEAFTFGADWLIV